MFAPLGRRTPTPERSVKHAKFSTLGVERFYGTAAVRLGIAADETAVWAKATWMVPASRRSSSFRH